jgi:hypothetical protein
MSDPVGLKAKTKKQCQFRVKSFDCNTAKIGFYIQQLAAGAQVQDTHSCPCLEITTPWGGQAARSLLKF